MAALNPVSLFNSGLQYTYTYSVKQLGSLGVREGPIPPVTEELVLVDTFTKLGVFSEWA